MKIDRINVKNKDMNYPIFILTFTNFPKENNAEYNGNRKNE